MADQILSLIILLLAASGLYLQSGIPAGNPRRHLFAYYTNLSNLLILLYELGFYFTGLAGPGELGEFLRHPAVRFSAVLTILVTFLIYQLILGPEIIRARRRQAGEDRGHLLDPILRPGGPFEDSRDIPGNLCVHYLGPILSLVRWLLLAGKAVPFWAGVAWLAVPAAYYAFVLIRARLGPPLTPKGRRYPYTFLDPERVGAKKCAVNVFLTAIGFFLLGLGLLGAARLITTFGERIIK